MRHSGLLGLELPDLEPGLHIIQPEDNLACIVSNAAGDHFVTAKDSNDLLSALSLPTFDVQRFNALLGNAGLEGFFGFISAATRGSARLTAEQEDRLRLMPSGEGAEPTPRYDVPDWGRRCLSTVVHTYLIHQSDGLTAALEQSIGAYDYYRVPLKLTVSPERAGAGEELHFNRSTCIRLVPLPLAARLLTEAGLPQPTSGGGGEPETWRSVVAGDSGVVQVGSAIGSCIHVDDEAFAATVSYELSPDLVRLLSLEVAGGQGHDD